MKRLGIFALVVMLAVSGPALAVKPGEQLPDASQETRARRLSSELRCLVCQNQSIDDSDASLAVDLRRLVRERISVGDGDQAIREFLVARYGDFILLKPALSGQTLVLWSLPGLALLLGAGAAFRLFRNKGTGSKGGDETEVSCPALSDAERHELDHILADRSPH